VLGSVSEVMVLTGAAWNDAVSNGSRAGGGV
jgi:hypothetical protein